MKTWTLTLTLGGLSMLGAFSIDTFLPSFPALAEDFGVPLAAVQLSLSAYLLAFAVMNLFYGTLSDSFGRKPVVVASLALFIAGSVGAALAPTFAWLVAFRVVQGLSAGGGTVIAQAIIRDRFHGADAQKLMSHVSMVFGLAPAIAPVIGGYLHVHFGWRSVFVFLTLVALLLLATSARLSETHPREARTPFHLVPVARSYWTALRHPQFVARTLGVGFAFGGMALYIASAAAFVIGILRLPETAFAWLFGPMIGGMVSGSYVAARIAHSTARHRIVVFGFTAMALGAAINVAYTSLFAAEVPWAVAPLALYTFGVGLSMPGMRLTALDLLPKTRGLAASLMSFTQMLVFAIVSGAIAPLLFDSAWKLATGTAVFVTLTTACWWIAARLASRGPEVAGREQAA